MKTAFKLLLIMVIPAAWHTTANAADTWTFSPKVAIYEKNASFTDKTGDIDIDIGLATAELGFTVSRDKFYLSLAYDRSLNSGYSFDEGRELNMARYDYALTAGYIVASWFNVFLGAKDGLSSVTSYDLATDSYKDQRFQDTGAFLGFGFNYAVNDMIGFSGSLAYASMSGTIELGGTGFTTGVEIDGTTRGTSYNLSANWTVRPDQVLQLGYKANRYSFEGDDLEYDQNFDMVYVSVLNFF
jgi:hypothetical protein